MNIIFIEFQSFRTIISTSTFELQNHRRYTYYVLFLHNFEATESIEWEINQLIRRRLLNWANLNPDYSMRVYIYIFPFLVTLKPLTQVQIGIWLKPCVLKPINTLNIPLFTYIFKNKINFCPNVFYMVQYNLI